jgi:hypothetical protein
MKNVICTIADDQVMVYDDAGTLIAKVKEVEGEPALLTYGYKETSKGVMILSFNDLDIIKDTWNALKEMQNHNIVLTPEEK